MAKTTTKKKIAPKSAQKRKPVSKSATPKKLKPPAPPKSALPEKQFFKINYAGCAAEYIYAENLDAADEIERRLILLQRTKKIRGYYRGFTPDAENENVVFEPKTPDDIMKI